MSFSSHRASFLGTSVLSTYAPRLPRPGRVARVRPVCLANGVTVVAEEQINDNRFKIRVKVSGAKTEQALEDGLEELGSSVSFPQFKRRRRNAPLPSAMITAALGEEKVRNYSVGKLVVDTICDHAKENKRLVREDLTADMAVRDLDTVCRTFNAGDSLEFDAEYDFMDRSCLPPP